MDFGSSCQRHLHIPDRPAAMNLQEDAEVRTAGAAGMVLAHFGRECKTHQFTGRLTPGMNMCLIPLGEAAPESLGACML